MDAGAGAGDGGVVWVLVLDVGVGAAILVLIMILVPALVPTLAVVSVLVSGVGADGDVVFWCVRDCWS